MLDKLEIMHKKHLIHRDVKPDNFLMGMAENSKLVYIIDFGLGKQFFDTES